MRFEEDRSLVRDGRWVWCSKLDATSVTFLKKTPPYAKAISPTERDRVALLCAEHAKHGTVQVGKKNNTSAEAFTRHVRLNILERQGAHFLFAFHYEKRIYIYKTYDATQKQPNTRHPIRSKRRKRDCVDPCVLKKVWPSLQGCTSLPAR